MPGLRCAAVPLASDVPLSVLDLAPVPDGATSAAALHRSLDLARHVEALGYHRHWVAEHHNMAGVASSATAVLIGQLAAATEHIRVGSGGVMLPNHSPLVVAEQFGTLEALFPGRVDLGIGRAPGTDPLTAQVLRRSAGTFTEDEFPRSFAELVAFFDGSFPDGHPYQLMPATPARGNRPAMWLLGSSGYSAQFAGELGLPFAFAHHFSAEYTVPALDLYRRSFRGSDSLAEPYAIIAVHVVCADEDETARFLAGSSALSFVRRRQGRPGPLPSPEEAAAYGYSVAERDMIERRHAEQAVGSPDTVRRRLDDLLAATGADELMVTTNVHSVDARHRSYELVAGPQVAGLTPLHGQG